MELCGININCHHVSDLLDFSQPKLLITVNAEAIVRAQTDRRLKTIINDNYSSIDGQIPLWLYRLTYKNDQNLEKISGSELIYSIPQFAASKKYKVFLLGGRKDSNHGAIEKLREMYEGLEIDGYSPPNNPYPFPQEINDLIIEKIRTFKPHILFVGFGMGKQEFWEDDNYKLLKDLGVKLIIGCGGSFEFASGKIKRAPKLVQNMGMEGLWRLAKEFKLFRLKRLLLSTKIFKYYFNHHIIGFRLNETN